MKTKVMLALGASVAMAGTAYAAKVGDKLYIKAKNTKVMKTSKATASVVTVLQPGDEVVWRGSSKKNKQWHLVTASGKKGVVFKSTLTAKKPSMEVVGSNGKAVDSRAFASSGAATKALGSGAKAYGDKNGMKDAVAEIEKLEELAKGVSTNEIAKHVKKNKLFPVVGEEP